MLTGLGHRAVSRGNNQDSAVHLSSTGDHVLDIVSMAGAVNVGIVAGLGVILNVSGVDGDAALSLLGSLINVGVVHILGLALKSQHLRDSGSQSSLAMVNVTNGTNVYVGKGSVKLFLGHWNFLLFMVKP